MFFNLPIAPLPIRIRAALLCVAADIPATRKALAIIAVEVVLSA